MITQLTDKPLFQAYHHSAHACYCANAETNGHLLQVLALDTRFSLLHDGSGSDCPRLELVFQLRQKEARQGESGEGSANRRFHGRLYKSVSARMALANSNDADSVCGITR